MTEAAAVRLDSHPLVMASPDEGALGELGQYGQHARPTRSGFSSAAKQMQDEGVGQVDGGGVPADDPGGSVLPRGAYNHEAAVDSVLPNPVKQDVVLGAERKG